MLGEASLDNLKPSSGAKVGDDLIMTKTAALEATAIIALEKEKELKKHFPPELISRARNYLHEPGLSVLREAQIMARMPGVHALHDPTEGGVATGIFEIAEASGAGAEVYHDQIPIAEETRVLSAHFGINPLGAFASGSLLIAVSPRDSGRALEALASANIPATRIGKIVERHEGLKLTKKGEILPLPVFHQDELSKIFG